MNTILQKRIEKAAKKTACPQCLYYDGGTCNNNNDCKLLDDFVGLMTFALQNQWISVEEALPTEKVVIAKLSNDFCGKDDCYEILHRIAKEHIDLKHPDGYYDSCGENVPTNAITHWMSIHELKGGEKYDKILENGIGYLFGTMVCVSIPWHHQNL